MVGNELKDRNKIFGLDLMRVAAIVLVLLAHTLWIYSGYNNLLTKGINFSGFVGVEIFFVLSGFLIGKSLFKQFLKQDYNVQSAIHFIKRRTFRIMPGYLLVLLLNLLVAYLLGYEVQQPWKYFVFLQNFTQPMLPFFPESWSMSIKEIPYFILPFVLLAIIKCWRNTNKNIAFLLTIILFILLPIAAKVHYHLYSEIYTLPEWNVNLRSVAIFRMDAVLVGVLASWIQYNHLAFWIKNWKLMALFGAVIMMLLIIFVGFVKISIVNHPFFWNIAFLPLISISSALFLPLFTEWKKGPERLRVPIQFLGAISYSIYLLHYSLILYLMKYFIDTTTMALWQLHCFTMAYLSITLILSYSLHTYFEKPLMKVRDKTT